MVCIQEYYQLPKCYGLKRNGFASERKLWDEKEIAVAGGHRPIRGAGSGCNGQIRLRSVVGRGHT
jgi:hypothetical protein